MKKWNYNPHKLPQKYTVPVKMQKEYEEILIRDIRILPPRESINFPIFQLREEKRKQVFPTGLKETFIQVALRSKYIIRAFSREEIEQRILLLDYQSEQYKIFQRAYYNNSNDDKLLAELEYFFLDSEKYEEV
ncbi:MAG: hypothetical protein ACFFCI_02360 [Promethearchaeota archaeon]